MTSDRHDQDIVISGAGIAGMVLAAGLARAGWRITLLDPAPLAAEEAAAGSDLRSTAFLMPAWRLFETLDLDRSLRPFAVPLRALRVIDTAGEPPRPRQTRSFLPADLGEAAFGYNLPNWLTRRELAGALADMPDVTLRLGTGFAGRLARDAEVLVSTTAGDRIACRLLIGADGRDSPVRRAAGITAHTTRYGQKALTFAVTHDIPHDGVSTEIYAPGGACTTVPLPDRSGRAASAIVWMADGPEAVRLASLTPSDLALALDGRSCGILGAPQVASPVRLWPVITRLADGMIARRTALVAEAAHVLPPIGAQGLNTSLVDAAALIETLRNADDPGADAALAAYEANRRRDIAMRARIVDLFNRVCRSDSGSARGLREAGLTAIHDIVPLRRAVMHAGMGAPSDHTGPDPA